MCKPRAKMGKFIFQEPSKHMGVFLAPGSHPDAESKQGAKRWPTGDGQQPVEMGGTGCCGPHPPWTQMAQLKDRAGQGSQGAAGEWPQVPTSARSLSVPRLPCPCCGRDNATLMGLQHGPHLVHGRHPKMCFMLCWASASDPLRSQVVGKTISLRASPRPGQLQ